MHVEIHGKFLFFAHGEETIVEIVVLHGGEFHHRRVTAVVVGEHQTVFGDNLTRAETIAELHDGIFQGRIVDIVQLLSGQFQTHLLHLCIVVILDEHGQPHALIRRIHSENRCRNRQNCH